MTCLLLILRCSSEVYFEGNIQASRQGADRSTHTDTSCLQGGVTYAYFRSAIVATAGRPFTAGDQVFISYGKQTNDRLLQFYGFVEEDNPNDIFVICNSVSKLRRQGIKGAAFTSPRLEWLQSQRMRKDAEEVSCWPTSDCSLNERLPQMQLPLISQS